MDEATKVNTIAKKLGETLINSGIKFIQSAYKISPTIYTKQQIVDFLASQGLPKDLSMYDEKYYVIDAPNFFSIVANDWGYQRQYITDRYDCDDFSFSFSSRMAEIFGTNAVGVVNGNIYDASSGNLIGGHEFNLAIVVENGQLALYLVEPMRNVYTKWAGKKTKLGSWLYEPNWQSYY